LVNRKAFVKIIKKELLFRFLDRRTITWVCRKYSQNLWMLLSCSVHSTNCTLKYLTMQIKHWNFSYVGNLIKYEVNTFCCYHKEDMHKNCMRQDRRYRLDGETRHRGRKQTSGANRQTS